MSADTTQHRPDAERPAPGTTEGWDERGAAAESFAGSCADPFGGHHHHWGEHGGGRRGRGRRRGPDRGPWGYAPGYGMGPGSGPAGGLWGGRGPGWGFGPDAHSNRPEHADLRSAVRGLLGAAFQVGLAGSAEQAGHTARVLDAARREIYRLLAADGGTSGAGPADGPAAAG